MGGRVDRAGGGPRTWQRVPAELALPDGTRRQCRGPDQSRQLRARGRLLGCGTGRRSPPTGRGGRTTRGGSLPGCCASKARARTAGDSRGGRDRVGGRRPGRARRRPVRDATDPAADGPRAPGACVVAVRAEAFSARAAHRTVTATVARPGQAAGRRPAWCRGGRRRDARKRSKLVSGWSRYLDERRSVPARAGHDEPW